MNNIRYHFMFKRRSAITNEVILQFMDFKGARVLTISIDELKENKDSQLKYDAKIQWTIIEQAHSMKPI